LACVFSAKLPALGLAEQQIQPGGSEAGKESVDAVSTQSLGSGCAEVLLSGVLLSSAKVGSCLRGRLVILLKRRRNATVPWRAPQKRRAARNVDAAPPFSFEMDQERLMLNRRMPSAMGLFVAALLGSSAAWGQGSGTDATPNATSKPGTDCSQLQGAEKDTCENTLGQSPGAVHEDTTGGPPAQPPAHGQGSTGAGNAGAPTGPGSGTGTGGGTGTSGTGSTGVGGN
jgi:hypothetical protein